MYTWEKSVDPSLARKLEMEYSEAALCLMTMFPNPLSEDTEIRPTRSSPVVFSVTENERDRVCVPPFPLGVMTLTQSSEV